MGRRWRRRRRRRNVYTVYTVHSPREEELHAVYKNVYIYLYVCAVCCVCGSFWVSAGRDLLANEHPKRNRKDKTFLYFLALLCVSFRSHSTRHNSADPFKSIISTSKNKTLRKIKTSPTTPIRNRQKRPTKCKSKEFLKIKRNTFCQTISKNQISNPLRQQKNYMVATFNNSS